MVLNPLPSWIIVDDLLRNWLLEDIGRGDRSTQGLFRESIPIYKGKWIAKETGVIAGLPIAERVFRLLNESIQFKPLVSEGSKCQLGQVIATLEGSVDSLLMGERTALNLTMRLSGIATATRQYGEAIGDLPAKLVDTRKTTPGLRILEKYASYIGGAINHRFGLDDGVMIKDNHIQAAGGIANAIANLRKTIPYPLSIEVETSTLEEVEIALVNEADIIMLDNMSLDEMKKAVIMIRNHNQKIKIEASGNITLNRIRAVAETGVDYISTSAPITRSYWLDLSMKLSP